MRRSGLTALAVTTLSLALTYLACLDVGHAAEPAKPRRAADLQAVLDCRAETDRDKRLACYDDAAAKLDEAASTGKVVVVDRAQARQVRREVFGLKLPSLDLFSQVGGDKSGNGGAEQIDRIEDTVTRAWRQPNGKWAVELSDGAVWRQIDDEPVDHDPHAGSKAMIRKASLGSYFLKLDGQRAIRVDREH